MAADAMLLEMPVVSSSSSKSGRQAPIEPMDEARFEAFYRKTAASLWSYLHRLTGDAASADDLLQKTFFRFIRANVAYASEEHMRRYVFRAATNLAFDHFRERKRQSSGTFVFGGPGATESAPASPDLRHDMMRVFADMKPRERALVWLAHVEELTHDEIAEALGIKMKSVRVLLFRARKHLADLLSKRGIGPEVLR